MCFEKPRNLLLFETHVASRRIKSKSQHKTAPSTAPTRGCSGRGGLNQQPKTGLQALCLNCGDRNGVDDVLNGGTA